MALISKLVKNTVAHKALLRRVPVASFHAGAPVRSEEEKETKVTSPAPTSEPSAFSDPLIAGPIGLACSIPLLQNNIYVLNEESQLACCFLLFCTSVYKFGGDAIASYFDERAAAVLAEHNELEDNNINMAKECVKAHKAQLGFLDDVAMIEAGQKELYEKSRQAAALKFNHEIRDVYHDTLVGLAEAQRVRESKIQGSIVQYAVAKVNEDVQKGGKAMKDKAFETALKSLTGKDEDEDFVSDLFVKYVREYAELEEAKKGKSVTYTPEEVAERQLKLDAWLNRYNPYIELKATEKDDSIAVKHILN